MDGIDDTIRALIEARQRQIDIELQQELEKIDEEYSAKNLFPSGRYYHARSRAERRADQKKIEVEAELLLQHRHKNTTTPVLQLNNPPYNKQQAQINFGTTPIPIPRNTNMETLCRVVFSSKLDSIWEWDEIITHEEWGEREEDLKKKWWEKTYHATLGINEKVGKATGVYDLLLRPSTKQVQINPKYLK